MSPTAIACQDWGDGAGSGTASILGYHVGVNGPNTAVILGTMSPSGGGPVSLLAGPEYFAFNLSINNQKMVGTGACTGCTVGACLLLGWIRLRGPSGELLVQLTTPAQSEANLCTWQGGAGAYCDFAPTRARPTSWSTIKQLYHVRSP